MTTESAAAQTAYQKLEKRFKRLNALSGASAMLHWDMATMMPPKGHPSRGEQLATLSTISHSMMTAPEVGDWISEAKEDHSLNDWQQANLREMEREYIHATALDENLVEALSIASTTCEAAWREARPNNDYASILPKLEELLNLTRQAAVAKAEKLGLSLYDALLDQYEPGGRSADIDAVFADLEDFLPNFLSDALDAQARRPEIIQPVGPFAPETQKELGMTLMKQLGFDFDQGRLDISLHPFCGGTAEDVRITTRYDEADFTSALMGVLHETGHALYELGLPKDWLNQPVGAARGMSVHESQSLLVEMQVSRSKEFLSFAAPIMREAFKGTGKAWETDNIYRLYTRVKPDYIRVDADEVTYPAHVILRYNLEKALIAGDLQLADLPSAWNDGFKKLLGLDVPTDTLGCLQDLHWYDGAFGYFPTYTLGAMTAAQLFDAARKQKPEIADEITKGDFTGLMSWLFENIHGKGSKLSTQELLSEATGQRLNAEIFKKHLQARYL